ILRRESVKKCPFCAEEIQSAAIKCRYCGEFVTDKEWERFAQRYQQQGEREKYEAWSRLDETQRQYLTSRFGISSPAEPGTANTRTGRLIWALAATALGLIVVFAIAGLEGGSSDTQAGGPI